MTETHDLVTRLLAAIEETERIAREAGSGTWSWRQGYGDMCNDPECAFGQLMSEGAEGLALLMDVHGQDVADGWQGSPHIAHNDPQTVLRRCAADRKTIKDWQEADADIGDDSGNAGFARGLYRALERLAEGYDLAEQQDQP